jgi:hypothetical protein
MKLVLVICYLTVSFMPAPRIHLLDTITNATTEIAEVAERCI